MTAMFRVWQPQYGERARSAELVVASEMLEAVEHEHLSRDDGPEESFYCVQEIRQGRGGKTRIVRCAIRRIMQVHTEGPLTKSQSMARCRGCERRWIEIDEEPHEGLCRLCERREVTQ